MHYISYPTNYLRIVDRLVVPTRLVDDIVAAVRRAGVAAELRILGVE